MSFALDDFATFWRLAVRDDGGGGLTGNVNKFPLRPTCSWTGEKAGGGGGGGSSPVSLVDLDVRRWLLFASSSRQAGQFSVCIGSCQHVTSSPAALTVA